MNKLKLFIIVFISLFGLMACAGSSYESLPYRSQNTNNNDMVMVDNWFLTELNNNSYQGPRITLQITSNKRVTGFSGCNRYFATVDIFNSNQLNFRSVGSTRKLCADYNSNQLEKAYLATLRGITRYQQDNSRLVLEGPAGTLVFYKKSNR